MGIKTAKKSHYYKLLNMIQYKCEWYGRKFIQIDPFFPSTKLCSNCGYINNDLTLYIREYTCPKCKKAHNRDINAAINIKNEGIETIYCIDY